jgi:hypothetical protein
MKDKFTQRDLMEIILGFATPVLILIYGVTFAPDTIEGGIGLFFIFIAMTIAMLKIMYNRDIYTAFSRTIITMLISYFFIMIITIPTGKVGLDVFWSINFFGSNVLVGFLAGIILGARADASIADKSYKKNNGRVK